MSKERSINLDGRVRIIDELPVLHRGSVKDLRVIEPATEERMGLGLFVFRDTFSIWDLKDLCTEEIPGKGAAICCLGARAFELARRRGIDSTYLGLVDQDGRVVSSDQLKEPTNLMLVSLAQIIPPREIDKPDGTTTYDYSMFTSDRRNFLVPLEIIYRLMLPQGSSKLKKIKTLLEKGDQTGALALARKLGLDHLPKAGEKLPTPYLQDVTTKLEFTDRDLSWEEARKIAGLSPEEQQRIIQVLSAACQINSALLRQVGVENADGKIEVILDPFRQVKLCDVACSMDECRFFCDGVQISKEDIRQYYERTQPALYEEVKEAKATGRRNWKDLLHCGLEPLDPEFKTIMSGLYSALTDACLNGRFDFRPTLDHAVVAYAAYLRKKGWATK